MRDFSKSIKVGNGSNYTIVYPKKEGEELNRPSQGKWFKFKVTYTPKGWNKKTYVYVWERNGLDASNYLIRHNYWGKQESVEAVEQIHPSLRRD